MDLTLPRPRVPVKGTPTMDEVARTFPSDGLQGWLVDKDGFLHACVMESIRPW